MTRIWSGRLQDQVYAGMAERLVRQSNNARLDPNVGVNPRVRRILARMHRAGLIENMAGLWLPDMYTADGENRVERMGGLTAQGALEQETTAIKPIFTRDDDRMNLLLQSILPGTLGASAPSGWNTTNTSGTVIENELVESDDPSGGHQAYFIDVNEGRVRVNRNEPVIAGQQILLACFVERNDFVSSSAPWAVAVASGATALLPYYGWDEVQVGEWAWRAFNITSTGSPAMRYGVSHSGSNTVGQFRFSRPCLMERPNDWFSWTEEQRQDWITAHYVPTTTLRQFAGDEDLRAVRFTPDRHLVAEGLSGLMGKIGSGVSLSFMFRLSPGTTGSEWMSLAGTVNDSTSNVFSAEIGTSGDRFRFHLRNDQGQQFLATTNQLMPLNDGRWHFLTLVPQLNGYWIFVDGAGHFVSSSTLADDFAPLDYPFSIGARNLRDVFDRHIDGAISQVIYKDEALDLDGHKSLMEAAGRPQTWDYTILVIPDTQYLAEDFPEHFTAMTDWIVENQSEMKIEAVLHVGDVTHRQRSESTVSEPYENISDDLDRLFGMDTPFIAAIGNHDYTNGLTSDVDDNRESIALWNQYLGPNRYPDGVFMDSGSSVNMYVEKVIGGRPMIILVLEFFPRAAVMTWADSVISGHPAHDVIVLNHAFITRNGGQYKDDDSFGPDSYSITDATSAEDMWANHFKQHGNVVAVFSGHDLGATRVNQRIDRSDDHRICFQQYQNYQNADEGGKGRFVVLHVNKAEGTAFRRVYNPVDAVWEDEWGISNIPWPRSV